MIRAARAVGRRSAFLSVLAGVLACSAPSVADVATAPAGYDVALAEGRKLEEAGDHAGAVRAFKAALASRPNDAMVLVELGWAQFKAGDSKQGEQTTLTAMMRVTGNPRLKSAAWYNLGRIYEGSGQKEAAVSAYRSANEAQASPAAQERLKALGGSAQAEREDPLEIEKLGGPFPTEQKLCAAQTQGRSISECACLRDDHLKAAAPYLEARICRSKADDNVDYLLAIRMKEGWFFREMGSAQDLSGRYGTHSNFTVKSAEQRDFFPQGKPQLLVRSRLVESTGTDEGPAESVEERLVLCGIGKSNVPSCTKPILEARTEAGKSLAVSVKVGSDGFLDVRSKSKKLTGEDRKTIGRQPAVFP